MHRFKSLRWWKGSDEGQATAEFAISLIVLVPIMLYSVFFYEFVKAKLKVNEASRYAVWELTVMGLSDWQDGNHDSYFSSQRNKVINEINQRYGDDLDSATGPSGVAPINGIAVGKPMMINVTFNANSNSLQNTDPQIYTVGSISAGDSVVNAVFNQFNFNTKGKVTGTLEAKVENVWLAKMKTFAWNQNKLLDDANFTIRNKQSLIAEQWDIKQGSDVITDAIAGGCKDRHFCLQVDRMTFAGFANVGGGSSQGGFESAVGGLGDIFTKISIHFPFNTTVASKALNGTADSSHNLDVSTIPNHGGSLKKHYTNTYKDTHTCDNSEYYKTYGKLGKNYMGCREELKQEGDCQYTFKKPPGC